MASTAARLGRRHGLLLWCAEHVECVHPLAGGTHHTTGLLRGLFYPIQEGETPTDPGAARTTGTTKTATRVTSGEVSGATATAAPELRCSFICTRVLGDNVNSLTDKSW